MKTVKTSWYRMSVSVRRLRQSAPGATTPGCLCSTKSGVALHIAPPWKTKLVPLPITSLTPVTNSSPCWPPEPSIEAPPPSSPKPSGTGTHYPWKWWRPPPLTLSCQGYQTEELPTVPAPPPPLVLCVCVCVCVCFSPDQYNSEHPWQLQAPEKSTRWLLAVKWQKNWSVDGGYDSNRVIAMQGRTSSTGYSPQVGRFHCRRTALV